MHVFSRRYIVWGLVLAVAGVAIAAASQPMAAGGVPLAIKGYDPVAYFTQGKPARGLPDIEYEWDEHRYRFSSVAHRDLFKADPVRYAPQFANFCAMALTRGEVIGVNPEYWLISDGKLYIFGLQIGPELFQRHLAENLAKVDQNRWLVQSR